MPVYTVWSLSAHLCDVYAVFFSIFFERCLLNEMYATNSMYNTLLLKITFLKCSVLLILIILFTLFISSIDFFWKLSTMLIMDHSQKCISFTNDCSICYLSRRHLSGCPVDLSSARLVIGRRYGRQLREGCSIGVCSKRRQVKTATSQNGDKPKWLQVQSKRINLLLSTMDLFSVLN